LVKTRVKAPKGFRDCKGQECDKDYEFEFDVQQPEISATVAPTYSQVVPDSTTGGTLAPQTLVMQSPPVPKEVEAKKLSHDDFSKMIPKGVNFAKCPGGDCGHMKIKNEKQTAKFSTCPGCESNTVPRKNDFCPTCGKNLEDEDLEEGVELEKDEDEDE